MPVSHLALAVSHIPTATSFYLAALQPLGYRYIGHQEDSIGLGVDSADFFITQAPIGTRPSPNHIAFLADDRNVVRDCYTASLKAGGCPSGAPNYRNEDCACFNAAVQDHDGNTVEFIFRQPHGEGAGCGEAAPSEHGRVFNWRESVDGDDAEDDAQSVARSMASHGSQTSKAATTKSRVQTALDIAKSTSPPQPVKSVAQAPANLSFSSKVIIGTALGAAASAALIFALTREESKNAKEESDHLAFMSSRSNAKSRQSEHEGRTVPSPRAETVAPSMPAVSQAPNSEVKAGKRSHHNYSTTESAYSRTYPRSTQAMRMLQETGYNNDEEVQEVMSRYNNLRPHPTRSHTNESLEHAPDKKPAKSNAGSSLRRASTLPVDAVERLNYYLEAPKSTVSRHSSRQGADDQRSSLSSYRSHRRTSADDDADRLKRHDSGTSMHLSRSPREQGSEAGRRSTTSTIKPSRRSSAHDAVQLPPPPIGNHAPSQVSRGGSTCYHPAAISLPPSAASTASTSRKSAIRDDSDESDEAGDQSSRTRARTKPYIQERDSVLQSWENFEAEESDGMGDVKTVLPEDSISCVDSRKPRKHRSHHSHSHSRSSRHSGGGKHRSRSGRSEASERTVRPAEKERKGSLLGFPIRNKEGSRFSFV